MCGRCWRDSAGVNHDPAFCGCEPTAHWTPPMAEPPVAEEWMARAACEISERFDAAQPIIVGQIILGILKRHKAEA